MMIIVWIFMIAVTSEHVCSGVVININTSGNCSDECCVWGECPCNSLSTALTNIRSCTVINITSESVSLKGIIKMGLGPLNSITITGNGAMIMCNNSGGVYCETCSDVTIEGITWDKCGDPNGMNTAGVTFNVTNRISVCNCTFQYSQVWAIALSNTSDAINLKNCSFLSNCGGLDITLANATEVNVSVSYFVNNGHCCYGDHYDIHSSGLNVNSQILSSVSIIITNSTFISNQGAMVFNIMQCDDFLNIQLVKLIVCNNNGSLDSEAIVGFSGNASVSIFTISSSMFTNNGGIALMWNISANSPTILISNSSFTSGGVYTETMQFCSSTKETMILTLVDLQITSIVPLPSIHVDGSGVATVNTYGGAMTMSMTRVHVHAHHHQTIERSVYIQAFDSELTVDLFYSDFAGINSTGRGAALFIDNCQSYKRGYVMVRIQNSTFHNLVSDDSVVYVRGGLHTISPCTLEVHSSNFTNNLGHPIYLYACGIKLYDNVLFESNTADNGAAIFLDQGSTFATDEGALVNFTDNSARQNGGAIYINLEYVTSNFFDPKHNLGRVTLTNNLAVISGNSIYFDIPRSSEIYTFCNFTNFGGCPLLYIPCHFNYSKDVDGNISFHNCTTLNVNDTKYPLGASPYQLKLYFPTNDSSTLTLNPSHNRYYIRNNILDHPVVFNGTVFDYFNKPAGPTQFNVHCFNCSVVNLTIKESYISVNNATTLSITLTGAKIIEETNISVDLTTSLYKFKQTKTTLIIELLPCSEHPGNMYSDKENKCICYRHNVVCSGNNNAIKRGYWFGNINGTPTTSLCPNHYCNFIDRKEVGQGYFKLLKRVNKQCKPNRLGHACGKCNSSGFTLTYDSPDCINLDHCSAGITILVVVLTCLYWIVIVVGVFSVMYFNFQISSGYVYGIIYYYSIVGILLDNNPYISDGTFQFVSILSSFAQLTPKFLGKICFVIGLSGIDQLFIHYSHAVAVSLLTLFIIIAARCSIRVSVFVSRCIIRVISLLLLLSYTSLTSTSLQLLQPLRFTDIDNVYTYASPHIQYFHDQHVIYGIVALICEVVVGIGLPLLLLLEPFLSRKINFIKIKPLLDQFQGCYKDKYRWFAAYYLICRQVIVVIVYAVNSDYYNMLFYLQTACVIIAMVHIWVQPYQEELLNALDGLILLVMVLVVNINTFPFLHSVTTELSIVLVILPLFLFCIVGIRKMIHSYLVNNR